MNALPLVSVIVPCYNHEQYVAECILSIINQRYLAIQLIVIDDGSSDHSVEVIKNLAAIHDFIFEAQTNIGLSATLNKAITKYATGEYIAFVASDDFWHPEKIIEQVVFLENYPQYQMIFCKASFVDQQSNITGMFKEKRLRIPATFENLILDKMGIPALTVLIKKKVFDRVGLFDEDLAIEDWDMWLSISNQYEIGYLDKTLAYYRVHSHNISSNMELMIANRFKIVEKWRLKVPKLHHKAFAYWQRYALKNLTKNNATLAKRYLRPSLLNRYNCKYYYYLLKYYCKC